MQRHLKTIRVILAILFFVALLISFADIKGNMPSRYHRAILYLQFVPSLIKQFTPMAIAGIGFLVVLILTLTVGRVYCSTICPVGIIQDMVIFLRRKLSKKQQFRFKKSLNILRYSFLGITIISLFFTGVLLLNLLDPYAVFGRIASHIYQPTLLFFNNLLAGVGNGFGLIIMESRPFHTASLAFASGMFFLLITMSLTRGRLYCNSVCPVGTVLGLLSKVSIFKIRIAKSTCTKCGKCQAACKANCINIKTLSIDESRCIDCYNCIQACEDDSIGYKKPAFMLKTAKVKSTDSQRRLLLATGAAYLASKAVPVSAQQADHSNHGRHGWGKVSYFDKGPISPPGSLSVAHIKDKCIACHLCVSVCPTKVLQPTFLEYGLTAMNVPQMDYGVNFCNYECRKCGEVCPTGAIIKLPKEEKKLTQIGKVEFQRGLCIVKSEDTACGSCSEHCPTQAVRMEPYPNGIPGPVIDTSICIGCGACEYACPVNDPHTAIYVVANTEHVLAELPNEEAVKFEDTEEFPF